ncbi:MAG: hypothetical protein ACOH5I_26055 [Oligoflexus sp.]
MIKHILLHQYIVKDNLNKNNVAWRTLISGSMISLIAIGVGSHFELFLKHGDTYSHEALCTFLIGIIGIYWALYTSFNQEFVDKFKYLANEFNNLPGKRDYLSKEFLNFAEDCYHYKLHNNDAFNWTFKCVVSRLLKIKENIDNKETWNDLMRPFPQLSQYFTDLETSFVVATEEERKRKLREHLELESNYEVEFAKINQYYAPPTNNSSLESEKEKIEEEMDLYRQFNDAAHPNNPS